MSGIRQRHGGGSSTQMEAVKEHTIPKPSLYMGGTAHWKNDEIEDIVRASVIPRRKFQQNSITDKAKKAKDALEDDPYSIEKIRDLGYVYASEGVFDKAANVMIRGWKRAPELKDPRDRFNFLLKTAEVSFRNRQYKQAHAVLMDIDEPAGGDKGSEDYHEKKAFQLLMCHALCEIGKASEAFKVFCQAIEGEEFIDTCKIWGACAIRLRRVGSHEAAKEAVTKKARTGQNFYMDEARMQTVETWSQMSDGHGKGGWKEFFTTNLEDGLPRWVIVAAIGFVTFLLILLLHWAEKRNMSNMKML